MKKSYPFPLNLLFNIAKYFLATDQEKKLDDLTHEVSKQSEQEQYNHLIRVAEKLQTIYGKNVDFNFIEKKMLERKQETANSFIKICIIFFRNFYSWFSNTRSR